MSTEPLPFMSAKRTAVEPSMKSGTLVIGDDLLAGAHSLPERLAQIFAPRRNRTMTGRPGHRRPNPPVVRPRASARPQSESGHPPWHTLEGIEFTEAFAG